MKTDRSREVRIGALIAIGCLIIFGAFFVIGKQQGLFTKQAKLRAKFDSVEGLTVGAAVRLGGVKVGTVERIEFSPVGQEKAVIVAMSVSSSSFSRIKTDSRAKLGSQGLLGDRTIDISLGSPSAQPINQGEYISTSETKELNEIISESGNVLADIKTTAQNAREISWKINYGTGSLAQIINDPRLYKDLDSLLDMWSDITDKINRGQGTLALLVNDSSLYNNLTSSLKELSVFMANVNQGEGSLGKLARQKDFYYRVDSLLIAAENVLTKVNQGDGSIGQFVNNAELYQKLNLTMDALNALIADIKKNPKRYVKVSLF